MSRVLPKYAMFFNSSKTIQVVKTYLNRDAFNFGGNLASKCFAIGDIRKTYVVTNLKIVIFACMHLISTCFSDFLNYNNDQVIEMHLLDVKNSMACIESVRAKSQPSFLREITFL